MIKSLLTKAIATKILAGTAVAAATGGVALAAADGHFSPHSRLAAPATSSAQPTDPAESDSSTDASPTVPSVPPTDGTSTSSSADETSGSAEPSGAVLSPSLHGLCTAYLAGVANSHGKALQNPAFTVLINAAGGADGVSGYCATLLSSSAAHPGKPSTHPAHPTHPAMPTQASNTRKAQPTQPSATHSNHSGGNGNQPTSTPTGAPSS